MKAVAGVRPTLIRIWMALIPKVFISTSSFRFTDDIIATMAPVRPKSKTNKPVKSKEKTVPAAPSHDDGFKTSKRDKRHIKHSTFLSKIEKSRKKPLKRRRPSKKLVANLDSLADALPDAGDEEGGDGDARGDVSSQVNVIRHKSLKHRPGALKRKEKLDRLERGRFAKNMAQMAGGQNSNATATAETGDAAAAADSSGTSARWAALRSFISQTMDQNPEFKTKPS